ncbi:hypothetical protein [Klebsiella quasipneumoniae]|uniref:hypothetical protein n=1 Tax=Klebsiella quasipneumoniae TaxID=1463165 RepID=UPI0021BD4395|nr:hypothetical protein [Klebsiella quasipneumoniae]
MNKAKPYLIDKAIIWKAWLAVKANRGSAGADGVTIEAFEHNLARNLYKIWNRLSSGCYMPQPVKRVEIPPANQTQKRWSLFIRFSGFYLPTPCSK